MYADDVEKRCAWMNEKTRQLMVEWARHLLQRMGDQWALRTWGPLTYEAPVDVEGGKEWRRTKITRDMWGEYPDTVKAVYNCCGGCPQAPLPAHGLISKPWWW